MSIREEFEKWDYETFGEDGYEVNELGEYEDNIKQQCWMAWQASRAALTIQLPFVPRTHNAGADWIKQDAKDEYRQDCVNTIQKQGMKVK